MNYKKAGRLTGILFIIGTVAGVACLSFVSIADGSNYLTAIYENPNKLIIGALLITLMGIACAGIAYSIYPILSKYKKGLAIGAVGFRTVECVFALLVAITYLMLIPIAKEFVESGNEVSLTLGNAIVNMQDIIGSVLGIAFSTGAILYSIGFYMTKLVPRWLSMWGIIAAVMHIVASVLVLFGVDSFSTINVVLNIPIALQEMVLAVNLIIFGYKQA